MNLLQYSTATDLAVRLPARADATPTFVVYAPGGGITQASTDASFDVYDDTTLSGAAAAGATSLSLTSTGGVAAGRKYFVGGAERDGGEVVTAKAVGVSTVTLARALRNAKAIDTAFQGVRIHCALEATALPLIARHYRVGVSWSVASVAQPTFWVPFDAVRYQAVSTLSWDDVLDLDALSAKRLPAGTWVPALMARALEMILGRIAQASEPGALVGCIDLKIPHLYLVRALQAENAGDEWIAHRDDMRKRFADELAITLTAAAFDDDQDGAIESHEGWHPTILLERA